MCLHYQIKVRFIHCQKTLYIQNMILLYHILKEKEPYYQDPLHFFSYKSIQRLVVRDIKYC
jgi:hypothetical protein